MVIAQCARRWVAKRVQVAVVALLSLACWQVGTEAAAQAPAKAPALDRSSPRLVIESGGHRAIIRDLIFSADGSELISVSDDKTIRVWSVTPDGRRAALARTIRGQIDDGRGGMIAAAALSPPNAEGQQVWLAVGGYLAGPPPDRNAIRLHDYATGEVRALLHGHSDSVLALAFSPDGRWLASAGKDNTLRLWDLNTPSEPSLDRATIVLTGHADHIYDLSWSVTGKRLASASYDHTVGLWDTARLENGQAALIKKLEGHKDQVRTVAFHPDGEILASGSKDQTVRLWRGEDGKSLGVFARTTHKIAALSFSPGGNLLLAGNTAPPKPKALTLWSYPAGKQQLVFTGHQNTVLATAFHPSGRWVASGGGDQKEILLWDVQNGDILSRLEGRGQTVWAVGFSKDGRYMSWGHTSAYTSQNDRGPLEHRFDLDELTRLPSALPQGEAVRAQEQVGDLSLTAKNGGPYNFDYRLELRRSGKRLSAIDRDNTNGYVHGAYSLTPDGQSVLSGGMNGELWLYDLNGQKRARLVGHSGEIKAVAISADGKWALSGSVDQTVRLWSLTQRPEGADAAIHPSLSFFPTADGEWIAWTPEGFFTASPQGMHLIGYSVNLGLSKTARYVSADQLHDRFYRPDLIHARLHGDPVNLWRQDSAKTDVKTVLATGLPPRVAFVTPVIDTAVDRRQAELQVAITDQGGGIGKVVWQVDGVTVAVNAYPDSIGSRRLPPDPAPKRVTLKQQLELVPGDNVVEVFAYSRNNDVASEPVVRVLTFTAVPPVAALPPPAGPKPPAQRPSAKPGQAAPPTAMTPLGERPRLHVVVVGIDRYRDPALSLNYAVSDGRSLAQAFRTMADPLFQAIRVTELYDDRVTLSNLDQSFAEIATIVRPYDVFVVYFAGHGLTLDGKYYFLPQDLLYENNDAVRRHAITQDDLQRWFARIPARRSLVLLDTCESGSFVNAFSSARKKVEQTAAEKLSRATGRATIVAATDNQPAVEGYKGHGVFTYVLLQALQYADTSVGNRDGYTGLFEIATYVNAHVPEIARQEFGFQQTPQVHTLGTDFPIAQVEAHVSTP